MADEPGTKPPRVVIAAVPKRYILPEKPSMASPAALDAFRQTSFLLGEELGLFERAMNAVLASTADKPKGPRGAAMLSVGSRAFSHLADACTLMCHGSYDSCLPLLRMALEAHAVQSALVRDDFGPYEEWFPGAVKKEGAAVRIDLGHSKAASVLAADDRLGGLYRLLMDLSMPHFGSALFFAAPETNLQKVSLGFASASFHLGFAQLITAWLLLLADEQRALWREWAGNQPTDSATDIAPAPADRGRCYVERSGDRWVFHNFRRTAAGQPKRIILG